MTHLNITDTLIALRRAALAAAIYADNDPCPLDALMHESLRWPVADTTLVGLTLPTAPELAAASNMPEVGAERLPQRITETERDAATCLIDSGLRVDFTPEQAQVTASIDDLDAPNVTPTRTVARLDTSPARLDDYRRPVEHHRPTPSLVGPDRDQRMAV